MAPCDVSSHRLHGAEVNVQGVHPAIDEEEAPMASNSVNGGEAVPRASRGGAEPQEVQGHPLRGGRGRLSDGFHGYDRCVWDYTKLAILIFMTQCHK